MQQRLSDGGHDGTAHTIREPEGADQHVRSVDACQCPTSASRRRRAGTTDDTVSPRAINLKTHRDTAACTVPAIREGSASTQSRARHPGRLHIDAEPYLARIRARAKAGSASGPRGGKAKRDHRSGTTRMATKLLGESPHSLTTYRITGRAA